MLKCGDAIEMPTSTLAKPHLWIIVTDPSQDSGMAVIVNVTTRRSHSDTTTILKSSDHPYIKHESVILYADAHIIDTKIVEQDIKSLNPNVTPCHCCSKALFAKIQSGLLVSKMTPNGILKYCKKSWDIS